MPERRGNQLHNRDSRPPRCALETAIARTYPRAATYIADWTEICPKEEEDLNRDSQAAQELASHYREFLS